MSDAYTVFWSRERCEALRRLDGLGKPVEVLFGGPHTSEPSFARATVHPGDDVYPIAIRAGTLHILGRTHVQRILPLEDYIAAHANLFAPYLREPPEWVLDHGYPGLSPRFVQASEAFDRFRQEHSEMRYLAPTCTDEAVECADGTPLRLDLTVSSDMLLRLRYRSQRRERDLHKYIRDGYLLQSLGVQGIYRLSEPSAREFASLMDAPTAEPA